MNDAPLYRARRASHEAERKLRRAGELQKEGRTGDAFATISLAILGYLADKMNKSASGLTHDEITDFLHTKAVSEAELDSLRSILKTCDGAQYSTASSSVDQAGQTLAHARELIVNLEKAYLG